jgi:F-type H+/Na+-transporting ATPase subunit alpha
LQSYLRSEQKELLDKINKSGDYNDEIVEGMRKALDDFKENQSW